VVGDTDPARETPTRNLSTILRHLPAIEFSAYFMRILVLIFSYIPTEVMQVTDS